MKINMVAEFVGENPKCRAAPVLLSDVVHKVGGVGDF